MMSGATGGIGAVLADLMLARGDEIIAVGRHPEKLAALGVRPLVVDLSRPEHIGPAVAGLNLTTLDALVHCAGVAQLGPVAETTVECWAEQLTVNLAGPAELTRATLPALRAARGHVVFLNFWVGPMAKPGWSAYAAAKFGLKALADALRGEEERRGVKVTSVYPACVATEMQRSVREGFGMPYRPDSYIQPRTVAQMVLMALDTPPDARVTDLTIGLPSGLP
jgi:NADP-dependent 3-hydroxy acid dehydrogenase YdfG